MSAANSPLAMPKTRPLTHGVNYGFPNTAHVSHPENVPGVKPRKRTRHTRSKNSVTLAN